MGRSHMGWMVSMVRGPGIFGSLVILILGRGRFSSSLEIEASEWRLGEKECYFAVKHPKRVHVLNTQLFMIMFLLFVCFLVFWGVFFVCLFIDEVPCHGEIWPMGGNQNRIGQNVWNKVVNACIHSISNEDPKYCASFNNGCLER
ncbi:hypothetical protein QBC44DRAFT_91503 [Cladorrhinum sp. PSN332]|nr:hypothetical protein QBC44DRAFT_91503 [Cladorrhinum sp. PSN332]